MRRVISDKGKGKSAILPLAKTTRIGIVLYSGAQLAAVLGLTDLFVVANRFSAGQGSEFPRELQISHWGSNRATAQLECVFETHPGQLCQPDCLIFPPTLEIDPQTKITGQPVGVGKNTACFRHHSLLGMRRRVPACSHGTVERQVGHYALDLFRAFGDALPRDLRRHQ